MTFSTTRSRQFRSIIGFAVVSILTFTLVVGWIPIAWGQIPIPVAPTKDTSIPDGVQRFGGIEVATVKFQNNDLFKVVSPTVWDRKNPGKDTPVEMRAAQIEANLDLVVAFDNPLHELNISIGRAESGRKDYSTNFDPKTLQVVVSKFRGETVILATDAYRSQPEGLLTVTDVDSQYYGLGEEELAQLWKSIIYQQLSQELKERSPKAFQRQLRKAFFIALVMVGASLVFWIFQRFIRAKHKAFKAKHIAEMTKPSPTTDVSSSDNVIASHQQLGLLKMLRRKFSLEQQHSLNASLRWLLNWGQVAIWISGTASILYVFPYTNQLEWDILWVTIRLLLLWFLVSLSNRVSDAIIDRFSKAWQEEQFLSLPFFAFKDAQRKSLRISTSLQAIKGLKAFVVWGFGATYAAQVLGVPLSSLLPGVAIVAFALSLGFGNLVKDLVNGCLILWEDQYGIGDVIVIGNQTGLVENMNLRITQIRDQEGGLVTIPNSLIAQVENLTRTWSRVDLKIEVASTTDISWATELVLDLAQQMYSESQWRDRILEPPELLGVEQISQTGILFRVWIKTQPMEQWSVGSELLLRMRLAFNEHSIEHSIHLWMP